MKIETDISKKFFSRFDEARGIALHKKSVLKNKNPKTLSYTKGSLLIIILLFILSIVFALFCRFNWRLFFLPCLTYLIAIIYLIYVVSIIIETYNFRKKLQFKNTIIIDENGITDKSYKKIKMIFSWNKIKGIVIGKYTITVLTDTPVYFYFDISKKDDVIKAIEKYGKKNLIIK